MQTKRQINLARTHHRTRQRRPAPFHGPAIVCGRRYTKYTHIVVAMVEEGVKTSHTKTLVRFSLTQCNELSVSWPGQATFFSLKTPAVLLNILSVKFSRSRYIYSRSIGTYVAFHKHCTPWRP